MTKQRIRLTEGQLHNIIRKCVNEAVDEIGDTHPGGRIGFAQDAANLAYQKGRTKQSGNILQSFEDSYNSYKNGRERNTPRLNMHAGMDSEMKDDYSSDVNYNRALNNRTSEPGQINVNGDDSDLETFRKPYQLLPARQRNNANKRVDDFKKYRDYMRSKGNVSTSYKGHGYDPNVNESSSYRLRKFINESVKRAINESIEDGDFSAELAEALGVGIEMVNELDYQTYGNGKMYDVDGEEYVVYANHEDAYDAAVEVSKSLIEDDGSIPNIDIEDFISKEWAKELANEEADYRTDEAIEEGEISEDERDEYWQSLYDEIVGDTKSYLENFYRKDELGKFLIEKGALDIDAMAEECVDIDGVPHYLARYDGNEIDLPGGAVAFRTE